MQQVEAQLVGMPAACRAFGTDLMPCNVLLEQTFALDCFFIRLLKVRLAKLC